jgi:hypothetical protein
MRQIEKTSKEHFSDTASNLGYAVHIPELIGQLEPLVSNE